MKIFLCVCILAATASVWAETLGGRVVGVSDGDTLTLLTRGSTEEKIRLSGIDAPEKAQPFGNTSKQSLSGLVFNKDVTVEWQKRDRYGRIVGRVVVGGKDVCLEQIKAGMTWHFKRYEKEQPEYERIQYAEAEGITRMLKRGLWSESSPIPPWDWRRQGRVY